MNHNPNLDHLYRCEKKGLHGVILEGSSRSGKTWSGIDFLIHLCAREKCRVILVRETYNSFKTTLYDDFNRRFPMAGLRSPFEGVHDVSTFWLFGSKISLMGADNPSKFHGATSDYFFINEALDIPQEVFDQLEQRCRKFWWMDYNPKYHEHWIYDRVAKRDDVSLLRTTFKDNPNISEREKAKILSYDPTNETNIRTGTADDFMWRVYGLGLRGSNKTGNEFYYNFRYTRHVKDVVIQPDLPLHISFDQNVVPYMTMTIYQIVPNGEMYHVHVVDEICLPNPKNNTEALCRHFERHYQDYLFSGLFFYGDATGRSRDTRGSENDYDIVERVLKRYLNNKSNRVLRMNPKHVLKREFINKIFANQYPVRIFVSPKCKNLLADMERIQEDADGRKHKPKKRDPSGVTYEELGHTSDTLDYFLMSAFKRLLQ